MTTTNTATSPGRVKQSRKAGWRKPPGAVWVVRGTAGETRTKSASMRPTTPRLSRCSAPTLQSIPN